MVMDCSFSLPSAAAFREIVCWLALWETELWSGETGRPGMKGMLCTVAPPLPLLLLLFTCGLSVSALSVLSSPSTIHLDSLTLAECCRLNLEVARRGRTEEGILEEGIEEERRRGGALKTIAAALKATHVGWISVFVGSGGRGGRGASNALVAKDTLERNPLSVGGINSLQKRVWKALFLQGRGAGEEERRRQ